MFEVETPWYCGYCGEENSSMVDPGGGRQQNYIEDCAVCCHPNVLQITLDMDSGEAEIYAVYED